MPPVVLVTRPEAEAKRLVRVLSDRSPRMRILQSPLQRIIYNDPPAPEGELIFTSRNGVRAWKGGPRRAWCVGDATAAAARAAGHTAVSAHGTAEDLLALIIRRRPEAALLHLRGAQHRGDLAGQLRDAGLQAVALDAYRQESIPFSDEALAIMAGAKPVVAPLYSPRSAQLFAEGWQGTAPLLIAAISPMVTREVQSLAPVRVVTAAHPDGETMLEAIIGLIAAAHQLEARGGGA